MQDRIARVVHDVLDYGLELKQRVMDKKAHSIQTEQQRLLALLQGDPELAHNKDYAGDPPSPQDNDPYQRNRFLGIKYALVCWLDEIFIKDTPPYWQKQWTESTLEMRIWGGTQHRAWRFWSNATKANADGRSTDALEVYLWCVLLGFRGDPSQEPGIEPVPNWIDGVRKAIIAKMPRDFPLPNEREAPSNVPPLYFRERYNRMLRIFAIAALFLIVVLAAFVIRRFTN